MNWYATIRTAAYANETSYLNSYLKSGFDPYDFDNDLEGFLESRGQLTPEFSQMIADDIGGAMEQWMTTATNQDKEAFEKYIEQHGQHDYEYDNPAYQTLDHRKMTKATWLVHFTNDAESVASEGFSYGHDDMRGLHLTTWKRNRQKNPGYNFAFSANDSRAIATGKKYGKQAVVFWSSAVEAYHYGDEEHQMIFWGPGVNPNMIFPIIMDDNSGQWTVNNVYGRRVFSSEDIDDCIGWIIQHHTELNAEKERERMANLRQRNKRRR